MDNYYEAANDTIENHTPQPGLLLPVPKGSSRIVIIFKRVHKLRWGGDQWPPYAFLNVDYDALHFHTGSVKSTFSKLLFCEGGRHKKRVLCVRF